MERRRRPSFWGLLVIAVAVAALAVPQRGPVPRIRSYLGWGCISYLLDGMPINTRFWGSLWEDSPLGWITGKDVVAVEYYRYAGEVPPELRRFAGNGDTMCGLVVFWTAVGW